jgi:hypothetical protein
MLEEGVEVELPTDLTGIIEILDKEVPYFASEGHGYSVVAGKATVGKRWDLMVKAVDYSNQQLGPVAIGRVELEKLDDCSVQLRIPPRHEQEISDALTHDPAGRFFGSFVCHTLNTLQRHQLIQLPGVLPTV